MSVTHEDYGFDENGQRVGVTEFDYDAVEEGQDLTGYAVPRERFTAKELDAAIQVIDRLLCWVWQDGMRNPEGIKIRAIVVCWSLLKPLRSLSLTGVAGIYGKKKQSLGRWVDQFKRDFKLLTPHMRPARPARGGCRLRRIQTAMHGAHCLSQAAQVVPISEWPPAFQDRAREALQEAAADLWPEKFS